jgi:hypothetical protein
MYHYLVTFNANIDGVKSIYGKLGASIGEEDEDMAIRQVREEAMRRCKKVYPTAKLIVVTVMDIEKVASEKEINAGRSFQL